MIAQESHTEHHYDSNAKLNRQLDELVLLIQKVKDEGTRETQYL